MKISIACNICGQVLILNQLRPTPRILMHYCPGTGHEEPYNRIGEVHSGACQCAECKDQHSVLLEQSAIEESRAKDGLEFEEWFWKNPMADLRDAWMAARRNK